MPKTFNKPIYSSTNRITPEIIIEKAKKLNKKFCRRVFGIQSDAQSFGYDHLCALSVLLFNEDEINASHLAIDRAREEIFVSDYSKGFQVGWDERPLDIINNNSEFMLGYEDGKKATELVEWTISYCVDYEYPR